MAQLNFIQISFITTSIHILYLSIVLALSIATKNVFISTKILPGDEKDNTKISSNYFLTNSYQLMLRYRMLWQMLMTQ